jgi:polyisoprenoid-binding protein YceI
MILEERKNNYVKTGYHQSKPYSKKHLSNGFIRSRGTEIMANNPKKDGSGSAHLSFAIFLKLYVCTSIFIIFVSNTKNMKHFYLVAVSFVSLTILSAFMKKEDNTALNTNTFAPTANEKWQVDKVHSTVKFSVSHMVVSEQEGSFKVFDGNVEYTKADMSDAKISFTIDINSINTDNEYRDKHLKGDDFFNAEKFPTATFTSTSFISKGNNKYELIGNLTLRDVTRPVTFDVTYGGVIKTGKGEKSGFKASTTINRFDYNLKWDKVTEAGGLVVGKEVEIVAKLEFNKVMQ